MKRMKTKSDSVLVVAIAAMMFFFCSLCIPSMGFAADHSEEEVMGGGLDELMEGFEDSMTGSQTDVGADGSQMGESAASSPSALARFGSVFSLDGYAKLGVAYNFAHDKPGPGEADWRGLSKLRGELQVELNVRLSDRWQGFVSGKGFCDAAYTVNGRSGYTDEVLDHYEDGLELREAHVTGRLNRFFDIKFGRQIVVWGKSDTIRVVDILNPLDSREPGLTDLEDLRLPVTMTKLDGYFGPWNFSAIAVHEIRFDKFPKFGSDFFPYPGQLPGEDKPSHGGGNTEYAAALKGTFSGWDASFFYADVYRDTPHPAILGNTWPIQIRLTHADITMAGTAVNVVWGSFIFKGEAAYIDGIKFFNDPEKSYSRTDAMLGIEYYGFDDMVIILEAANRHINGFDRTLKQFPDQAQKDAFQSVLRISRTFLNETLELEGLFVFFGTDGKDGKFQRLSCGYDLNDAVSLLGGFLLYQSGDLPEFAGIGDNDRLFLEIKYSF